MVSSGLTLEVFDLVALELVYNAPIARTAGRRGTPCLGINY